MGLSLMIMAAVLSSYVFLGRNFTRSLGLSSANEPTLESQGRRTLSYFAQDVRMASSVVPAIAAPSVTPSVTTSEFRMMTLILPVASGTKSVIYYYNNTIAEVLLGSIPIPANSLVRIDQSTATTLTLHTNLLTMYFRYFDAQGQPYDDSNVPYTTTTGYLSGIKQVSLEFTSQGGNSVNGTQTQIYASASPRVILRNKQLRP